MFSSVQTGNRDMNKGRANISISLTEKKVLIKCAAPRIIQPRATVSYACAVAPILYTEQSGA
jgi:hypothetical protein